MESICANQSACWHTRVHSSVTQRARARGSPRVHRQVDASARCGSYLQWDALQPGRGRETPGWVSLGHIALGEAGRPQRRRPWGPADGDL